MEWQNKDEVKISKLDNFMDELLSAGTGKEKKEVVDNFRDVIKSINPIDLFYLKRYQETEEVEVIRETGHKFANVFYEGLSRLTHTYEHQLFKYLLLENRAIEKHLGSLKSEIRNNLEDRKFLKKGFIKCLEFDKKFQKYENIIFPNIEDKLPSSKPLQVLWSLYDEARELLGTILKNFENEDSKELQVLIGKYYFLVYGIINKEQLILLPVAYKLLEDTIMDDMLSECSEYGFTFVDVSYSPHLEDDTLEGIFKSRTGSINFKQLTIMMNHLPIDFTFVDKFDRVKYFNDNPKRHFPRNPSVIGRQVKYCHPPKSVEMVEKIIESFRNGTQDFAEFWMDFKDIKLYITYYAMRDESGNYEGVLEVSQDVTHIKSLQGQNRLLNWDK